jgi:hypothetical protein
MIVAIAGKRGVGKSTFANRLVSVYGFKKVSFADPLKLASEIIFPGIYTGMTLANKETPYFTKGETRRDFLIALGQLARYYDEMVWVKAAKLESYKTNVVVDDLRFKNEAEHLKKLGAKLVRIERYKKYNPFVGEISDISEIDLDEYKGFDMIVNEFNNETLFDLNKQVDKFIKDFVH